MKNFNWKLFIILVILGSIGVFALISYEMAMLNVTELPPEAAELDPVVITVINSFSKVFMVVVAVFFGMLMMRRTGLGAPTIEAFATKDDLPKFSWRWFNLAIGVSLIGSL